MLWAWMDKRRARTVCGGTEVQPFLAPSQLLVDTATHQPFPSVPHSELQAASCVQALLRVKTAQHPEMQTVPTPTNIAP